MTGRYLHGMGLSASLDSSGAMGYYLYNGHGDVTALTSSTGAITKTYAYDAFGTETSPSASDTNPFRYCGEYYDQDTESVYLRARVYDPATGRFWSEDPAEDGDNWYVYGNNNPLRYFDPSGFITQEEMKLFESGGMAPMAYTYLMKLTYDWYLADSDTARQSIHAAAEAFRATNYTKTGIKYYDDGIAYMSALPASTITQEQHYFRNKLNVEYNWTSFKKLLDMDLPQYLRWVDNVAANYHQNTAKEGKPNRKYVSKDGHFEMVFSYDNVLLSEANAPLDMGTYNYYGANVNALKHYVYDVSTYNSWENTEFLWLQMKAQHQKEILMHSVI